MDTSTQLVPRIGLLATGNELTEGDILNTNGQNIARQLMETGLAVGYHVMVADKEEDIVTALRFLLQHHTHVIITGGLGPTSDDRTRYALSNVVQQPLVFNEACWQQIVERYQKIKLDIHPSNRQQALFPTDAEILPNLHGSAAGCQVNYQDKIIYMLPGPPHECLPMFHNYVLPHLKSFASATAPQKIFWRLLGAIESDIAALVDEAVQNYTVTTGYRVDYPYLEVKLYAQPQAEFDALILKLEQTLAPYLLNAKQLRASELLQQTLAELKLPLYINDTATHGHLQTALTSAETLPYLHFTPDTSSYSKEAILIKISGLDDAWLNSAKSTQTGLILEFFREGKHVTQPITFPLRQHAVFKYAVEYAALAMWRFLTA